MGSCFLPPFTTTCSGLPPGCGSCVEACGFKVNLVPNSNPPHTIITVANAYPARPVYYYPSKRNPCEWIQINGKFYHFCRKPATFFEAKSDCTRNGAKLFEPENEDINNQIAKKAFEHGLEAPWLGIKLKRAKVGFVYDSNNSTVVWKNFDLGEPNGALGGEGCVHMAATKNMKWNDNNCLRKFDFICEKI